MSSLHPHDLIDAVEAAEILRVSKGTVYHWIRMGYFPHYKIGRLFRLSKRDLAQFLEFERRVGISPNPTEHGTVEAYDDGTLTGPSPETPGGLRGGVWEEAFQGGR